MAARDAASALLVVRAATGSEAMIALLDVAEIDRDAARQTILEMADALLDHYLDTTSVG